MDNLIDLNAKETRMVVGGNGWVEVVAQFGGAFVATVVVCRVIFLRKMLQDWMASSNSLFFNGECRRKYNVLLASSKLVGFAVGGCLLGSVVGQALDPNNK